MKSEDSRELSEIADKPKTLKRKGNNQIEDKEERFKLKEQFADWLIEQGQKHRDKRETQDSFAARVGLHPATLSEWRRQDRDFVQLLRERMPDVMALQAPDLYPAMVRYALAGNPAMMKLALQQAKLLEAERSQAVANVQVNITVPRPSKDVIDQ